MSESKDLLKELLRQLEEETGEETSAEPAPAADFEYLHTSMEERARVAVELLADKLGKTDPTLQEDELQEKLWEKRSQAPQWVAAQPLKRTDKEE